MKNYLRAIFIFFTISFGFLMNGSAQYQWTQMASLPGSARFYACAFSIGHYGFVGGGSNGSNFIYDFWQWKQSTNTWTQITNYPGAGSAGLVTFTINGIGYVGFGADNSGVANDLWAYDTSSGWTQKASFPGTHRYACFTFVIGKNAYVGCGDPGAPAYLTDMWMYNSISNTWTQKASFPLVDAGMVGFALGKNGYAGTGGTGLGTDYNNVYQYDTTTNTWSAITSLPYSGTGLDHNVTFTIGTKGFVGTGRNTSLIDTRQFWAYDTATGTWSAIANLSGVCRNQSTSFSIGNFGYVATGYDSLNHPLNDLWQWGPIESGIEKIESLIDITLYPNPSNGNFTISYSGLSGDRSELIIADMLGRTVNTSVLIGSEGKININESELNSGIYMYQLISSNKNESRGKFIISK